MMIDTTDAKGQRPTTPDQEEQSYEVLEMSGDDGSVDGG